MNFDISAIRQPTKMNDFHNVKLVKNELLMAINYDAQTLDAKLFSCILDHYHSEL